MAAASEAPIDGALHEPDTRRGTRDVADGGQGAVEHDDDLGSDLTLRVCLPQGGKAGGQVTPPATPSG